MLREHSANSGVHAIWAGLICFAPILVGCGGSPAARYGAYEQAVNRGDVDAAMAIIADDFAFKARAGEAVGGRPELQRDLERGVVFGRVRTSEQPQMRNGVLHLVATDNTAYYSLLGMEPRKYRLAVVVKDRKITEMTVGENLSGGPTEREALPPFLTWARGQRRAELAKIFPIDTCANGTESGKIWLELLELWRVQAPMTSIQLPTKVNPREGMSPVRFPKGTAPGPNVPAPQPEKAPAPRRPQ